jgi:hypothetical protein
MVGGAVRTCFGIAPEKDFDFVMKDNLENRLAFFPVF